jgi:CBS domain-containing protein
MAQEDLLGTSARDPNRTRRALLRIIREHYIVGRCADTSKAGIHLHKEYRDTAMNVENILMQKGTDVTTIGPEASVKRAAEWLRAKDIGALVVVRDDAVLGIISERDIVHAFSQYGETVASMPVKDIMTHGLITVAPGDDLNRMMRLMTRHRLRHLPVLRNGKLAGIISIGDVVKRRLDDLELEANVLHEALIVERSSH